jgi:urease subunit alpha
VSVTFVSSSLDAREFQGRLGSRRTYVAVERTRGLTRADLHLNRATADVRVDPADGTVMLNGRVLAVEPVAELPLSRSHFLA